MLIGFDYETYLMGPCNLTPKPVALGACINTEGVDIEPDPDENLELATSGDGDLWELLEQLLDSGEKLVGVNVAFDLGVALMNAPDYERFAPKIFAAVNEGRVADVMIREKLLNLAQHGELKYLTAPDGNTKLVSYSLAALAKDYLGITVEGKEGDDAWRLNYHELDGLPLGEWPEDAVTYAVLDTVYPTQIYLLQEERRKEITEEVGVDPLATESFRVAAALCLHLCSVPGIRVDPEEHAKIVAELAEALQPENLALLVEAGILRPGKPPQPYANGARAHVEGCKGKARKTCDCPVKMKSATKPSINKKRFAKFVTELAEANPSAFNLKHTDKGNLKLDKEFLDDHYRLSPVLEQYRNRAAVQKLVTTDMPRMEWPKGSGKPAEFLHPSYDVLKETGRTSSYASKIYPSTNAQNPHPRVRACIVPREGYYLYSSDFSGMELVTLAQKCYDLFGQSTLRDVINKGWDSHAYLGAHLAYFIDDDFHEAVNDEIDNPSSEQLYLAFQKLKDQEGTRKFWKHYRTFAKPTGLGYPGGLGPKTFVEYAHATYKIEVDEELAGELRNVWFKCYPEMQHYLQWVNKGCKDPYDSNNFSYLSPLGMLRTGANYCAAANGAALQTPGAEGALLALCSVVHQTYVPGGSLYLDEKGVRHRPLMFIHDEIVGEVRVDVAHETAMEVSRLMVEAFQPITPDVTIKAEPALMLRWNKGADPVFDSQGRLIPWVPSQ